MLSPNGDDTLGTLGALRRYGHGLFGWCRDCGSPSRYWVDVRARRTPKRAIFNIDLAALRVNDEDWVAHGWTARSSTL